jgi:hypothetical protein
MDFSETGWKDVDWVHLAQDRDQWQDLVNTVGKTSDSIKHRELLDQLSDY